MTRPGQSPARGDRHGVSKRRLRVTYDPWIMGVLLKVKQSEKAAWNRPFGMYLCTHDRSSYYVRKAKTPNIARRPQQPAPWVLGRGGDYEGIVLQEDDPKVLSFCWCGREEVYVPLSRIRRGLTYSCSERCFQGCEEQWDEAVELRLEPQPDEVCAQPGCTNLRRPARPRGARPIYCEDHDTQTKRHVGKRKPKPTAEPQVMLLCRECGLPFVHPRQRGRRPHRCPSCQQLLTG